MRHLHIWTVLVAGLVVVGGANAGVCEYANTTMSKVTTGVAGVGVATGIGLKVVGVTAVAHSSGAAIAATASSGYLAGTLGAVGAVTGVVTAPATLIIGGVAVVAAGSTIAYCHFSGDRDQAATVPTSIGKSK